MVMGLILEVGIILLIMELELKVGKRGFMT